jgi:hypothetical protein
VVVEDEEGRARVVSAQEARRHQVEYA